MPGQPIPFAPSMQPDRDEIVGGAPLAVNAVWDGSGFRRRPGLAAYSGAPATAFASTAISGLHLTTGGHLLAVDSATPARAIYDVTASSADNLSDGDGTGALRGSGRPVFAETEAIVAITGGAEPQKIDLTVTPPVSSRLGGDPPLATHVVANNGRLLLNNTQSVNNIRFSDTSYGSSYTGHETWPALNFLQSDARADKVAAIGDSSNEVIAFGRTTTQGFSADSVIAYASVASRDFGCSAPYSIVRLETGFAWIDHKRRIILSDCRTFEHISADIQAEIDAMASVELAYGYQPYPGFVAWRFPDGRTLAYDTQRQTWALWMGWNSLSETFSPWLGSAGVLRDDTGVALIGTTDGAVRQLAYGNATDMGESIVMQITTPFVTRGSSLRKWCKGARFMFRRGEATGDSRVRISWRDDLGPWQPDREIPLSGESGDYTMGVPLQGLGVYRMRQWRLLYSGPDDLVFAGATEEFELEES